MNKLAYVGLGVAAVWLLSKANKGSALNRMKFHITGLSMGGTVLSPEINVKVTAQNPTDTDVTIQSMTGDLYLNGNVIANLSNFTPFNLKGNTETEFNVKARLSVIGSLTQVINILSGTGGTGAVVTIKGTINAAGVVVPIDLTYKLV